MQAHGANYGQELEAYEAARRRVQDAMSRYVGEDGQFRDVGVERRRQNAAAVDQMSRLGGVGAARELDFLLSQEQTPPLQQRAAIEFLDRVSRREIPPEQARGLAARVLEGVRRTADVLAGRGQGTWMTVCEMLMDREGCQEAGARAGWTSNGPGGAARDVIIRGDLGDHGLPQREVMSAPGQQGDNQNQGLFVGSDPVNPATGEMVVHSADLAFPGAGLALERVYRSGTWRDGPLGRRWSLTYEQRLVVPGEVPRELEAQEVPEQVLFVDGDGRALLFQRAGATGADRGVTQYYGGPAHSHFTLERRMAPGVWVLASPRGELRTFSSTGYLAAIGNAHGEGVQITWRELEDGEAVLGTIADSRGHRVLLEYEDGRLRKAREEASSLEVSYQYNEAGDLAEVRGIDGSIERFEYDDLLPEGPRPLAVDYELLDEACALICADEDGCETRCQQRARQEARGYGQPEDLSAKLVAIRDTAGTELLRNEYGRDPRRASYGRVVRQQYAGKVVDFAYLDLHRGATDVDLRGLGTMADMVTLPFMELPLNLCPEGDGPFGSGTRQRGGPAAAFATVTRDVSGQLHTFFYDAAYQPLLEVNHATDERIFSNYDSAGRLTGSMDRTGKRVCRSYFETSHAVTREVVLRAEDGLDSASRTEEPASIQETEYAWIALATGGRVLRPVFEYTSRRQTDRTATPRREFRWDDSGNLRELVAVDGTITSYRHNARGLLDRIAHPDGSVTRPDYDPRGYLKTMTYDAEGPSPVIESHTVDPAGRTTRVESSTGRVVERIYAGARLERETVATSGGSISRSTRFEYDAEGQLVRETGREVVREYAYDLLGFPRMLVERPVVGAGEPQVSCFRWAHGGWLLESVGPDGRRVRYQRDNAGRVKAIEAGSIPPSPEPWDDACAAPPPGRVHLLSEITYDEAGRIKEVRDSLGHVVHHTFDGFGRLVIVTDPAGASHQQGYDPHGGSAWSQVVPTGQPYSRASSGAAAYTAATANDWASGRFSVDWGLAPK